MYWLIVQLAVYDLLPVEPLATVTVEVFPDRPVPVHPANV